MGMRFVFVFDGSRWICHRGFGSAPVAVTVSGVRTEPWMRAWWLNEVPIYWVTSEVCLML